MSQINKRDSRGLNEAKLRQKIKDLRPDFVYVHLGINDIMQKVPLIETLKNFLSLKSYIDSIFGTKLVVSLTLFKADPDFNNYVTDLRNT